MPSWSGLSVSFREDMRLVPCMAHEDLHTPGFTPSLVCSVFCLHSDLLSLLHSLGGSFLPQPCSWLLRPSFRSFSMKWFSPSSVRSPSFSFHSFSRASIYTWRCHTVTILLPMFLCVSHEDRRQALYLLGSQLYPHCLERWLTHRGSSLACAAHTDHSLTGLLCVWPAWIAGSSIQVLDGVYMLWLPDHSPFLVPRLI